MPPIGRYDVIGHLATGGMAEVLLGRVRGPSGFERPVVIKWILPHLAKRPDFRQMFLNEARIVARIRHRNVVAVHELGEASDDLFLVMEYLEGESLATLTRLMRRNGERLPPRIGVHITAALGAGLHAAHEIKGANGEPLGVVHRDVSPHNVFILYDGQVKVIDFGIAKAKTSESLTQTGEVKGKFSYMAPEQCRAEPLDRRADIFALGVILFETTTGARLFSRDNDILVFKAICEDPIPSPADVLPDYPPELVPICRRALARERDDRYATAADLRTDLLAAMKQMPGHDTPEDELSALMHRLFEERIAQKRDLLAMVERGESVANVPPGEESVRSAESRVQVNRALPLRASQPPQGDRWRKAAWAAAIAGVAAGVVLYRMTGSDPVPDEAPPVPANPEAPAEVGLHVLSSPPGAEVFVAGVARGKTPIEIAVPRGAEAIEIELRLEGYEPAVESVVVDRDQRMTLRLQKIDLPPPAIASAAPSAPVVAAPAPPAGVKPPAPAKTGGFHRFD